MPVNPDARHARARLRAHRLWHPGDDLDDLTTQCYRELERTGEDEGIDDLVARAPAMTADQIAQLHRLVSRCA